MTPSPSSDAYIIYGCPKREGGRRAKKSLWTNILLFRLLMVAWGVAVDLPATRDGFCTWGRAAADFEVFSRRPSLPERIPPKPFPSSRMSGIPGVALARRCGDLRQSRSGRDETFPQFLQNGDDFMTDKDDETPTPPWRAQRP